MDEYLVLDEKGKVIGKFSDVNSLYNFVSERIKEGKKVKIIGPPTEYVLIVNGKEVGKFKSAEDAYKVAKNYILKEDVEISSGGEYEVFDEEGRLLGKFTDVDSLYNFVSERVKEGKKVKIIGPKKVYFLL